MRWSSQPSQQIQSIAGGVMGCPAIAANRYCMQCTCGVVSQELWVRMCFTVRLFFVVNIILYDNFWIQTTARTYCPDFERTLYMHVLTSPFGPWIVWEPQKWGTFGVEYRLFTVFIWNKNPTDLIGVILCTSQTAATFQARTSFDHRAANAWDVGVPN